MLTLIYTFFKRKQLANDKRIEESRQHLMDIKVRRKDEYLELLLGRKLK